MEEVEINSINLCYINSSIGIDGTPIRKKLLKEENNSPFLTDTQRIWAVTPYILTEIQYIALNHFQI